MAGHRAVNATGTAFTGACVLKAVQASSAAAATVTVYDNTSAAGTIVYEQELAGAESPYDRLPDIKIATGLHVVITGTADAVLHVA